MLPSRCERWILGERIHGINYGHFSKPCAFLLLLDHPQSREGSWVVAILTCGGEGCDYHRISTQRPDITRRCYAPCEKNVVHRIPNLRCIWKFFLVTRIKKRFWKKISKIDKSLKRQSPFPSRGRFRPYRQVRCFYCQEFGHYQSYCPLRRPSFQGPRAKRGRFSPSPSDASQGTTEPKSLPY